ncbi:MAG: Rho termination factor N-terminal domain-containing protein [Mojavia pulchra JT2-VF2]|uniref:Rho termination factor N-terminal domain-containing protein n=1 Tax=Mojavia pulchra JT2-VF2 TaxID=287848 RepID=A0A951Q5A0_9NOST|nr:Rho termination factor N-terminal domain-containing protein [Mojavia pulchra JT2-VF2]
MQSILTVTIIALPAAYIGLVAVQFVSGLVQLWNSAKPQVQVEAIAPVVPVAPQPAFEQLPCPWDSDESLELLEERVQKNAITSTQLLLLPAKEIVVIEKPKAKTKEASKPSENLQALSVTELKKRASNAKIKGYSRMSKNQLISVLA